MKLRAISVTTLILFFALLSACSSGPTPPEKGSPAWLWAAAKETFAQGDWVKSTEHLGALTNGSSEFADKARPWELLLLAGMADGYIQLADAYELGGRANKSNPSQFRKASSEYRNQANRIALAYTEKFGKFQKAAKGDTVVLEFAFPKGSVGIPMGLGKIQQGIALPPPEATELQTRMVSRAVVMEICESLDAVNDPAKGAEALKGGSFSQPLAKFTLHMATDLYSFSQIYSSTKLDIPDKMKFLVTASGTAAAAAPEGKEKKELLEKIEAAKKKLK